MAEPTHRNAVRATLLAVAGLAVSATAAGAAEGTAPLDAPVPSHVAQLSFPLADGWSQDVAGPRLNRGVYGRDLPVGTAICQVRVVTRGQARTYGLQRTRPAVRFLWSGGTDISFRAERGGRKGKLRWYRSGTGSDPYVNGPAWQATGVAVLPTPRGVGVPRKRSTTVVLSRASALAHAYNPDGTQRETTPEEDTQCGHVAPAAIADGLRTMLAGMSVKRR